MKKVFAMLLTLALAASLFGCGSTTAPSASGSGAGNGSAASAPAASSSAAASSGEDAGKTQESVPQEETSSQQSGQQAAQSSQPGSGAAESQETNPIDQFYQPLLDSANDNATMIQVTVAWRDAWQAELKTLALQKEGQLTYAEDKARVEAFVTATENEAAAITDLKEMTYSDLEAAPADRNGATGTGFSSDAALSQIDVYRTAFQQLLYTLNYEDADNYAYTFDAAAAQSALEG